MCTLSGGLTEDIVDWCMFQTRSHRRISSALLPCMTLLVPSHRVHLRRSAPDEVLPVNDWVNEGLTCSRCR